MGQLKWVVVGLVLAWSAYKVHQFMEEPPIPYMDPKPWWGPGEASAQEDISINKFKIDISEKVKN